MSDNVNHTEHYNIPGRKECIEEMIDLYGVESVITFCKLNSYKYIYRHELKNGEEDMAKAKWYSDKGLELSNWKMTREEELEAVGVIPTTGDQVDAVENDPCEDVGKNGRWIYDPEIDKPRCSICGGKCVSDNLGWIETKYCPDCGAKMG